MAKRPPPPKPIDDRIRKRLREVEDLNQSELARHLGRGAAWLNKYMYGSGHATIDDIVGMAAYFDMTLLDFIDAELQLSKPPHHSKLLRAWRDATVEGQAAALAVLSVSKKGAKKKRGA
jgi:transcriptional regulator with XRE-family HTH domain